MKLLKGVLIDVKNKVIEVKEIEDTLDNLYEILNCDMIEITQRKIGIGNDYYDIVCDEEGLLKETRIPSAFDSVGVPLLVGNLFIVKNDGKGNLRSLTDKQIEKVLKFAHMVKHGEEVNVGIEIGNW